MTSQRTLADDLIELVREEQRRGRRYLDLPPKILDALRPPQNRPAPPAASKKHPAADSAAAAGAQPRRPAPAAPQQPAPVEQMDWETLQSAVAGCRRCPLWRTRMKTVFGEGNPHADLMFIGEGPGFEEDRQGRPFVGPAGQLLTRMIEAMQFRREQVYIANIVKCRPPGNRNPRPDEAQACLPYLYRQIALVQPRVIVLLGNVPLEYLLGAAGIMRLHGQWREFRQIPVLPTFHPAFLLRSPQRKREAWEDLKKVMRKLGKDPEQTPRPGKAPE